jgi:phosphate uptake regulator
VDAIKRKKISRVGSGAYSLYIPKKWIDEWTPRQQDEREVDLHQINESLLLTPVIRDHRLNRTIPSDVHLVRRTLLSGYVRGLEAVKLLPETEFDSQTQAEARRLLRHLDEQIVAICKPTEISFHLNPNLPTNATDHKSLLLLMGAKVQESLVMAQEAVESYGSDVAKTMHSLQMLAANHEEDVSRIFYQSGRLVANLELPLNAVSDFQLLGLATADLYRMSLHTMAIAAAILETYGLKVADLAYPPEHLAKQATVEVSGIARDISRSYRSAFADAGDLFNELLAGLTTGNMQQLQDLAGKTEEAANNMQGRIFATIQHHWGTGVEQPEAISTFNAYRISIPLGSFMGACRVLAGHAMVFLEAQ